MAQTRPPALLAATFVMSLGVNAYSISPASVAPVLMDQYAVTRSTVGLSISAFILGNILSQLPSGIVMDRYENRRLALGATVVVLLAAVVEAVTRSYLGLLVPRFVVGLVFPFLFIMSTKNVGVAFAGPRRGVATSVFVASAPTGLAVGQFATPLLAERFGLATAFLVYPLVTVAGLGLFYLVSGPMTIRDDDRVTISDVRTVLGSRPLLLVSLAATCSYAVYFFLNSWVPTYAAEQRSFSLAAAGAVAALVPVTGIVARPGGGWLSDRIGARRRPVIVISFAVTVPAFLAIVVAPTADAFALLLLFVGFAIQFAMGVYYVFVHELAPAGAGGTGLALFGTVSFSGSLVAPVVGGWLVDAFSWSVAFAVFGCVGVLGILLVVPVSTSRVAGARTGGSGTAGESPEE